MTSPRFCRELGMLVAIIGGTACGSSFTSPSGLATMFVGAGDIADCSAGAEATAKLLDSIGGTVFTAGDNAYGDGTPQEFANCYDPTWGRHKNRTRPSPGNHDYSTPGASGYYAYFGDRAGPPGLGYYSFNLGSWHIVSLNSNVPADVGSAQVQWLRTDLGSQRAVCTLAYWHHPVFSSFLHGNDPMMKEIWRVLYEFRADVIINGHDHDYERFAPQDPDGHPASARGIREFVVGTGGYPVLYPLIGLQPNSEVHSNETFGVIVLTLLPNRYDWEFIPVAGGSFRDSGSATCVR